MTQAQDLGLGDARVLGLLALAGIAGVVFVAVERRVEQPMLDLDLFSNRLLSVNLVTGWLTFVSIVGLLFLAPFYLQEVLGYDTRTMGLLLAVAPVFLGLTAPISGNLSDRVGPRPILVVGLGVLLAAYLALTTLSTETSGLTYALLMIPVGLGLGIFQSPNNSAVMGAVPPHRLGVTSGLLTITRITGQITGIAVMGTIWAARVTARSGGTDPTLADPAAQAAGFVDVLWVVSALTAIALALATWGLLESRRARSARP
jgi:MFS family permease